MSRKIERPLSAKLKAMDTLSLESMASGLRSMRKGQKHLLAQIEAELLARKSRTKEK